MKGMKFVGAGDKNIKGAVEKWINIINIRLLRYCAYILSAPKHIRFIIMKTTTEDVKFYWPNFLTTLLYSVLSYPWIFPK